MLSSSARAWPECSSGRSRHQQRQHKRWCRTKGFVPTMIFDRGSPFKSMFFGIFVRRAPAPRPQPPPGNVRRTWPASCKRTRARFNKYAWEHDRSFHDFFGSTTQNKPALPTNHSVNAQILHVAGFAPPPARNFFCPTTAENRAPLKSTSSQTEERFALRGRDENSSSKKKARRSS